MKYSTFFPKSRKQEFKDELSANAILLTKAGYIDQLMSGSYTLLPLGFKVAKKIEQIIREEMNKTGAQELLMPLLHPKEIWNETGRWDSAREVMFQFEKNGREFALSFTHEEIVLDLIRKHSQTYKDYPIKIYHFSTKFRDEPRAKSGILRTREFLMKDLYSLHTTQEDFEKYYWEVSDAYLKIFKRLGLDAHITEAAGGVFTKNITHEFQVLAEVGEDTIYFSKDFKYAKNKEIMTEEDFKKSDLKEEKAIEVGNIFSFGTDYSEKMGVYFTDEKGEKKPALLGSYGIGLTRVMGALVEVYHDDRGITWPERVSPFQVHLVSLNEKLANTEAQKVYETLKKNNIDVLWDDREASAGEKFANADLLGFPYRLVVSEKSGKKIEFKKRESEETQLLDLSEVMSNIK